MFPRSAVAKERYYCCTSSITNENLMRPSLNRRTFILGSAAILASLSTLQNALAKDKYASKSDFEPAMSLPASDKLIRILDAKGNESPDGRSWFGRAAHLVSVLWPAMAVVSQHEQRDVDADLYKRMRSVSAMEDFVDRFGDSLEAQVVSDYLDMLPGYPNESHRESFEVQFGFVEMLVLTVLVEQGYTRYPAIVLA